MPEPLDLTALIADDEQMVRRLIGEDIQLITHLEPSLDLVRADTGQLRQVLLNLVVNAWDAMPHGGTLTISTSNRELGDKEANRAGASPGKYVQLTVADTGIGMTEEVPQSPVRAVLHDERARQGNRTRSLHGLRNHPASTAGTLR